MKCSKCGYENKEESGEKCDDKPVGGGKKDGFAMMLLKLKKAKGSKDE